MTQSNALSLADERLADWERRANFWYVVYYALGLAATLLIITLAARPFFIAQTVEAMSVLGWLAAMLQGASTFLVALPKAAAYRAAWRHLWLERMRFVDDEEGREGDERLLKAIARGWASIDGGYGEAVRDDSKARKAGAAR